jgi:hypothetical protein
MKRRTKAVLLVGPLTVVMAVATVIALTGALAKAVDPQGNCDTGFSRLISCTYHWSSKTTHQSTPIFTTPANATSTIPSGSPDTFRPTSDITSWAIADCPSNYIARRLLCAAASDAAPAQTSDDDAVTGLPRPKPWFVTTAKNSTFIKAFHVETPLDLAGVLRFYRLALSKRGWTETDGAVIKSDGAVIAFTTSDGPALLRLSHQDDRTIADLSLRKPAATDAAIPPMPIPPMSGQVRLLLGNDTDEEAVITINEQTIELAAGAKLTVDTATGRRSPESREITLPPGKYKVSLKIASGAVQNREFEVAADETWGLVAGPAGVPLPLHLY